MPQKYSNVAPSIEIIQYRKRFQLLCGLSILLGLIIVIILLIAVLYFAGVLLGFNGYQVNQKVQLKCATVSGVVNNSVVEYLGIPYAVAPINDFRFLHAKEIIKDDECETAFKTKIDGVYAAHNYKSPCVQYGHDNRLLGDEDCLYLNVFVPPLDKPGLDKLPVVFVIHGVFFSFGQANMPGFSVTPDLVKQTKAIHVTCNYRLGPMGSFVNPSNGQTNHGLSDLLAALNWVHKNIASFHGDPANVVLLGSGSGSTMTLALYNSVQSANLFSKIWLSSPAFRLNANLDKVRQSQTALYNSDIKLRAVQKNVELAKLFEGYTWHNLSRKFQRAWFNIPSNSTKTSSALSWSNLFFLVNDGNLIQTNDLLKNLPGTSRVIPTIVGNSLNDADLIPFPNTLKIWSPTDFKDTFMTNHIATNQKLYEELEGYYVRDKVNIEDAYTQALTDVRVTCPLDSKLKALIKKPNIHLFYRYVVKDTHQSFDAFSLQHRTKYSAYMWDSIVYFGGYKHLSDYGHWNDNDIEMTNLFRNMMYQLAYTNQIKELQISNGGYVKMNLINNGKIERNCYLKLDECKFWEKIYGNFDKTAWVV